MSIVTITYLQMLSRHRIRSRLCPDNRFVVREATVKQWRFNRFLYDLVGNDWTWVDKLSWSDVQWKQYAEADSMRTFGAYYDGSPAGYFELHSAAEDVEISYFGLAPAFIGKGLGGYLLTVTLEEAWRMNPNRVWVHTCSQDHPGALSNYQARGMEIYQEDHVAL